MIYLDNAATSFPKPRQVVQAMCAFGQKVGANPGRSGHRLSVEAARTVYRTREQLARLFHAPDPLRIVFCLNATEALNLALQGLLRPGMHVVTSSLEHNSVMRPLRMLAQQGVQLTVVQATARGGIAPDDVAQAIRRNTAMIVINHASNVTGSLQSVRALGRLARRRGVLLLVDAAQTAGCVPIDLGKDAIDLLAFSGHKALCGPQGTGGLVIGKRVDLKKFRPLKLGGTGSRSEREFQPDFLPDRFESGTPNTPGLAGLEAGVRFVLARGVATIRQRELALTQALVAGLRKIPRVTVHGSHRPEQGIAVVSFTVAQVPVSSVVQALDEDFGILCRGGLHCAPAAHRSIGTFPAGTVRLSAGYFNTRREIDRVVAAVGRIAGKRRRS